MTSTLAAGAQAIVDALIGVGVRAVIDERDVNPPCAYVAPPTLHYRFGKCYADADWRVVLVVPDSGRSVSLDNLGALMAIAAPAIGAVQANPVSFAGVDGAPPLPAYELTVSNRIDL